MSEYLDPWTAPGPSSGRPTGGRPWHAGRNRILAVLGTVVVAGLVYTLVGGQTGVRAQGRQIQRIADLKSEIKATDIRIAELDREASDIRATRERRARTDYNMVRPNEMIYEIVPAESLSVRSPEPAPGDESRKP